MTIKIGIGYYDRNPRRPREFRDTYNSDMLPLSDATNLALGKAGLLGQTQATPAESSTMQPLQLQPELSLPDLESQSDFA